MKRKSILSFFLLLILAAASLSAQSLLSVPQVYPGDVLTAVIYQGRAGDDIQFILEDQGGRVRSHAPGLPYLAEELEGDNFIGLIGLGSDLQPGQYTLRSEIRNTRGLSVHERPVLVRSREFLSEDIPLSTTMSDLRTDDSQLRQDQARKLWALLNRTNEAPVSLAGVFLPPVEEYIESSWYGDRRTYLYADGETASALHNGIDMAGKTGSEIFAPLEGTVVMAEERIITGWTVVLEHLPGVYSLYYHMDRIDVEMEAKVAQGEVLGTLGSSGLVTGPHLHWELRVNTIAVDPERFLSYPLIDKDGILSIINDTKEQGR